MDPKLNLEAIIIEFISKLKKIEYAPPYQLNMSHEFNPERDPVLYSGPYFDTDELDAAIRSLLTSKWASSGEKVHLFEHKFSKKFNIKKSAMVNSGSSANLVMIASLKKYFGWADGDEIIISVVGFPTTLSAITINNLTPVFVDIDFEDLNWNLNQIEEKITSRTRAVFSSPVLGNPFDFDFLSEICEKNGLIHILDNCDSLGSKWKGKYLNEYAIASSTSFYPAHDITTLEGGMISSDVEELIKISKSISGWGRACYCMGKQNLLANGTCGRRFDYWIPECDEPVDHKYVFDNVGYNLKALDLQGSIGITQLQKVEEIIYKRRLNYERISNILKAIPGLRVIKEKEFSETSWFGVPVFCKDPKLKYKIVRYLEENRIQTRNYFAGNILQQPAYKNLGSFKDYPNATKVLEHVFFLGTSPTISEAMLDYISKTVQDFKNSVLSNT